MNVQNGRDIDSVIILGCGTSINQLSENEKKYINRCKTVIAINKFMAFYKKSGLLPTHVYFADSHDNSLLFLQRIFNVCKQDKLAKLHFILNVDVKSILYNSSLVAWLVKTKNLLRYHFWKHFLPQERIIGIKNKLYLTNTCRCNYSFITIKTWKEEMPWASSLSHTLFHYRGSLTSVLNYCSITKPNHDIYLVGNDFYGSNYFFEDDLKNIGFNYTDWTTQLVKKEGKHFSFQNYEGTKMSDMFPFIIQSLLKSGNQLYCINKQSLLVSECKVPFKKLPC